MNSYRLFRSASWSIPWHKLKILLVLAVPLVLIPGAITDGSFNRVQAQSLQNMSCYDLWFERNAIFANKGYCFRSQRAQSVFGTGCFPPYGQLSRNEQNRVDAIQRQERIRACQPGGGNANPQPAPPQGSPYAGMSCNGLWYERNAIFARNGHCFQSNRGRAAFGAGCFPPYGQLGNADQREVDEIIRWERRGGCR